jgi:uncharacterized repeat protein (TIGR01451 family)
MSASRFLYAGFIGLIASLLALFSSVAVVTMGSPNAHRASAQQASDLTVSLTSSATKAKIGDFVGFTVRVENTGATTISAVAVNLNLPDALDARAVSCPGDSQGIVTSCNLGDFAAGSIAEVLFVVQVGSKATNGPVTAFVSSSDATLTTAAIPALKIVGPSRR